MSPDKSEYLVKMFQRLFEEDDFEFECHDGWLSLIEETLQKLSQELEKYPPIGEDAFSFQISQIKEKYGLLNIYFYGALESMHAIAEEASQKSASICEICGKEGTLQKERDFWWVVRCKECAEVDCI